MIYAILKFNRVCTRKQHINNAIQLRAVLSGFITQLHQCLDIYICGIIHLRVGVMQACGLDAYVILRVPSGSKHFMQMIIRHLGSAPTS
jgi:hypothetical protein